MGSARAKTMGLKAVTKLMELFMSYRDTLTVTVGLAVGVLIIAGQSKGDFLVAFLLFVSGLWVATSQEA